MFTHPLNDPTAQCNFYRNVRDTLQQFPSDGLIIGGDFNCPLNEQDKEGGRKISTRANSSLLIKELMETFDLSDVWRELHPNEKQFTWATPDRKIQCRLDYWLVFKGVAKSVNKAEIIVFPHGDRHAINNGNRTEWSSIRSVIIRVINKLSDGREAGVRFVDHEYDYRQNWTTRSPVTN